MATILEVFKDGFKEGKIGPVNKEILFATHNRNKLSEARHFLSPLGYVVYGLDDLYLVDDVVEDGKSYKENAEKKARAFSNLPFPVFSDDSGFEVEALDGGPGLFSARFAASFGGYDKAMAYVIEKTKENRKARFVCTICLLEKGKDKPLFFEGVAEGKILEKPDGEHGFGFDPIFETVDGVRFGICEEKTKTEHSHRGKALLKLATYLAI